MPYNNNSNGNVPRNNGNPTRMDAREEASEVFARKDFQKAWMLDYAEFIGKASSEKNLTSSKIRSIYGEIKRIQMGEFAKENSSFYLLRPKVAYAVGREKTNVGLQLFKLLFDKSAKCVKDKDTFLHFANFMEAVLAYHRAYVKKND